MRKRKQNSQEKSPKSMRDFRNPSLHELSDIVPERRNVIVKVSAIPLKDAETEDFIEKLKEQLLRTTIDNCQSLFPPSFTVGDVLNIGGTFILRALANVPKESRLRVLHETLSNMDEAVQKLD